MSGTEARLRALERRWPAPAPAEPEGPWDVSALSPGEVDEMVRLDALAVPPATPGGRWDYSALDDDQLDRLADLVARVRPAGGR